MTQRYTLVILIALGVFLARPTQVFACDSWSLSCLLGVDDIADRDAARREAENAQNAQAKIRQAEINAQRDQALRQADNALHIQVLQGQITLEQARIQMEAYKALLESNTQTQNTIIAGQSAQNIAAIQAAAQVSIVGVQESGETVRQRLLLEAVRGIVILALIVFAALVVLVVYRLAHRPPKPPRVLGEGVYYTYQTPVQRSDRSCEVVPTHKEGW